METGLTTKDKHSIPLSVPEIRGDEWRNIKDCLDTGWVSSVGSYVDRFEQALSGFIGVDHAVACMNGTSALHIALLVAGIKPDEEVLVPALSFIASANAVRYTGAYPVFMDVHPDIWQMDPQKTEDFLTRECRCSEGRCVNKNTGRVVRAILPVHTLGHPVDMDPICDLARRFNLVVVEDAAESLGALYKGKKVGGWGDIGCFSFNGNKIITTGGGGMIVTSKDLWAEKARYLTTQAKDDPVESVHHEMGFNYRMTNIQAAMGVAQMNHLDAYIAAKRKLAERYQAGLSGIKGVMLPQEAEWAQSIFWLYTVRIDEQQRGWSSREGMRRLAEAGIQSRPLWCPLPRLRPFADCDAFQIEVADQLYDQALSLPSSVSLTEQDQDRVMAVLRGE